MIQLICNGIIFMDVKTYVRIYMPLNQVRTMIKYFAILCLLTLFNPSRFNVQDKILSGDQHSLVHSVLSYRRKDLLEFNKFAVLLH